MARKKAVDNRSDMDRRIDDAIAAMSDRLEGMDDARREMAEKELRDYFWCYFRCDSLRHEIDDEGVMVEGPKGGLTENKKLTVFHKLTGRKSTMFSQIMRWLPKGDEGAESDALDDFLM